MSDDTPMEEQQLAPRRSEEEVRRAITTAFNHWEWIQDALLAVDDDELEDPASFLEQINGEGNNLRNGPVNTYLIYVFTVVDAVLGERIQSSRAEERRVASLNNTINTLNTTIRSSTDTTQQLQKQLQLAQDVSQKSYEDNNKLHEQILKLNGYLTKSNNEITRLQMERNNSEAHIRALKVQHANLEAQVQLFNTQNTALVEQITGVNAQMEEAMREQSVAKGESTRANKQIEELRREGADLQAINANQQQQIDHLNASATAGGGANTTAQQQLASAHHQLGELRRQLATTQEQLMASLNRTPGPPAVPEPGLENHENELRLQQQLAATAAELAEVQRNLRVAQNQQGFNQQGFNAANANRPASIPRRTSSDPASFTGEGRNMQKRQDEYNAWALQVRLCWIKDPLHFDTAFKQMAHIAGLLAGEAALHNRKKDHRSHHQGRGADRLHKWGGPNYET